MRILDIDLDFFLDRIATDRPFNLKRLDKEKYVPWTEAQVVDFLEINCALSTHSQIPGKVFVHHDELFHHVGKLILQGAITDKIDVVHIDAHLDIWNGIGDDSYKFIIDELINESTAGERYVQASANTVNKVNAGNFIIYMCACNMISHLTFVKHPGTKGVKMPLYYLNNDVTAHALQLKSYGHGRIRQLTSSGKDFLARAQLLTPTVIEEEIPLIELLAEDFKSTQPFDRMYVTTSPSYTPVTSDKLIAVLERYMM